MSEKYLEKEINELLGISLLEAQMKKNQEADKKAEFIPKLKAMLEELEQMNCRRASKEANYSESN